MSENSINNVKQEKSLKDYFLEFKKLAGYSWIWLVTNHEKDYKNINLYSYQNFFVHLIGLRKLPMHAHVKTKKIIERINKEIISFSSIRKDIKSLKNTRKNLNEKIKYVNLKIKGLKNIKSLDPQEIFEEFNLIIFESEKLKEHFPLIKSELCLMKREASNLFLFHLMTDNNRSKNSKYTYYFFKSFTYLYISKKISKEKNITNTASEILKCKSCRILGYEFKN